MTTFALVRCESSSIKPSIIKARVIKAVPENNSVEEDFEKPDANKQNRRLRKNGVHDTRSDYVSEALFISQIGLIYLKPMVGFSTSVYFHSSKDLSEENQPTDDSRYALTVLILFLPWQISLKGDLMSF